MRSSAAVGTWPSGSSSESWAVRRRVPPAGESSVQIGDAQSTSVSGIRRMS